MDTCIIHEAAHILSCSGLLFGDIKPELVCSEASEDVFLLLEPSGSVELEELFTLHGSS